MSDDKPNNYNYDANAPAAILFTALFGLTLLAHFVQAITGRCRYLIPLLLATSMETAGYAFRYIAIKKPTQDWPVIMSEIFIIVAPAFLAANEYMIFGRMMAFVGSEHGLIRPSIITKLFVGADVIAILTQAAGGSMLNGDDMSTLKIGRIILISGLSVQVGTFAIFMAVAIAFDLKTRRLLGSQMNPLRPLIWAFYASAILIIIRSIYRTIEFSLIDFSATEETGYVVTHEWLFYVFDSLLILIATAVFNFFHPSRFIPSRRGLRMDGTTYEVDSSWWCCCCCSRKKRKSRNESSVELRASKGQEAV
ncbi:RTA1-domain-containing protein [Ceratobasidium sp. AG-I]|nr:RTA1-domain-containing protein [Ceratobasidium sp. AG-I]